MHEYISCWWKESVDMKKISFQRMDLMENIDVWFDLSLKYTWIFFCEAGKIGEKKFKF